ncbi:tetratricopeptide repeat protein [Ferrovibrio terrae]|uniref:Tetratricopeptide repeat protein n=1 Tax=Ferrovibrio terrae TaxID=2594003 RepID=A0A516GX62_9PROT|nr:tetratricopeptide repeat protein [Ferrovibrio terrae]
MNRKQRRAQEKTAGKQPVGTAQAPAGPVPAPEVQREANRFNDQALQAHAAGRNDEAISLLRMAITLNPGQPLYHNNLGELLRMQGLTDLAMASQDEALRLNPNYAEAHSNRGNLLRQLQRREEAIAEYRAALRLKPDFVDALNNLGAVLLDQEDHPGAAEVLKKAVKLNPEIGMAQRNLGMALSALNDLKGAEAAYTASLTARIKPADGGAAETHLLLGDIARAGNDLDGAMQWYERGWRERPGYGEAHNRYAVALMVDGRYREAWPHFEARWSLAETEIDKRPFTLPFWKGEALAPGQTLLLFTEQGVGESLVLWSVLPELLARGITPVIECDPRMIPILQRSFPGIEAHGRANPPHPRFAAADLAMQATLFDLARVFRNSPADCTGALPIRADVNRAAGLRAQYQDGTSQPLVGIAWHSGSPKLGAPKSAKLTDFAPFLTLPGPRFVDLQYGNRAADRDAVKQAHGVDVIADAAIDQLKDLDAFAAQVAAMDVVVSTSNTTAHMAAALGKPTLILLHHGISPHWYWTRNGETTPWYPTARLLRQPKSGDWGSLAENVAAELKQRFS